MTRTFWHYTMLHRAFMICRDDMLLAARAYVPPDEQPVIWFTSSPIMDRTAAAAKPDMLSLFTAMFGPRACEPVRIGIPSNHPGLYPFNRHAMNDAMRAGLIATGRSLGVNPRDWWCYAGDMPGAASLEYQRDDGVRWRTITFQEMAAALPITSHNLKAVLTSAGTSYELKD